MKPKVQKFKLLHSLKDLNKDKQVKVALPKNTVIVDMVVAVNKQSIIFWAIVDAEEQEIEDNWFAVYATGQDISLEDRTLFCKTVHFPDGDTYHVFRVFKSKPIVEQ